MPEKSQNAIQQKNRREYLISRKRCVRCMAQDAYTLAGRQMCAVCAEKKRIYSQAYGNAHRAELNLRAVAKRTFRREHGLCVKCGQPKEREDRVCCNWCREQLNRYNRNYRNYTGRSEEETE